MAILSNGKFYGFLCSVKATGRKLSNGVKEYVEDFVSGFAGHGWKLWEYIKGKWKLEIDALLVRGQFTVFELLISKIRSIMGAQTISQGQGKVKSARISDDGTEYLIELEDEDVSLVAHDFIRCQTFSGTDLRMYHVEIESVDLLTKTLHIPLSEFNLDDSGNVLNPPKAGDDLVQFGNSQNKARQSAIYLHADENGQPAIDVMFDIDSKDWTNKIKIRVGGDIPGTEGLKGFYSINGMIKAVDENGALIYGLYPDGTVNIGKGNIVYNPQNNKVTLGSGVTLSWSNLDEETKENLKGEPGKDGQDGTNGTDGKDGTSLIFMGEFSSAPANPQNGYWYRNTTDKKCYVYQDGAWYVMTEDGKNGLDGEGSISADLDDEMQSVACSLDGTVVFGLPITTTFSMFYGTTELPLDSLSVGSITGVTATSDRSTGIVKVTAITAAVADVIRIPITGRVTYKGSQYERTLHLSINKVKPGENGENGTDGANGQNAVIYSLQPSTNIIKRDADGNSDVSNISCRVMKTDGASTVVSSLPVGYSMDYIIDSGNATSYTPDKQISVSGITDKIQFRLYNETSGVVLIDRETIAVVSDGKKGLDGINGEDGKDGLSITWKGDLSSAPANPQKNWAYRNTSNGIVYIYNGTAWELMVADGQDGTDGTDGTDGLSVFITYHDSEDEPSRPTGSGTSGGWHTNATKDVVWISQKVASSASSGTWGDPIRFKGLPGKYTELRYKYAFGKPATPTGTNPAGWSLSPDREDITFSYSGNFTKDGDYYVSPSPTSHSSTYKQRVSFTTRRANQMIHIEIDVSSEQNYDKGIVEALDTSYSSSNEHAWEGSGVTNAVVDIAVPTAGSHFVEIVYTKDSSTSSNEDRVKFRMLDPTTCWYSTAVIDGKTTPSWSEPVIFPTDSKTEEQVYLLAKSKRNVIDLPASNEYVNEYIGDAPEYSSSKFYSAGNIVKYNNVYKVAIQAHSGIAPTNEAYWEDVLWWVDNPRGASETYPYEYTCERTLQGGKWGEYKSYRLFGHYGKDGEPGADGKPGEDANLLPWVEDWNNNKTEIGGEYLISPKIFSGTKDSSGKLTGVALGRDCVTVDGEKKTGIFALDQDDLMLELDPLNKRYVFRGTNIIGSPNGQRVVISPDSKDIKIFDDNNKNVLRIDGASKDSLNDLFSQNIPTINVKNIPASVPSQEREYMVDITDPIYVTGNVALDGRFFGGYTSSSPNTIFVEIILKAYSDSSLQNIIYADYIYSKVVSYKTEHIFNDEMFTGFLVSGYNVLSLRLAMSEQYPHSFSINNMSITPVVNEYLSSLFANGISLGTSSKNLFSVMNRRVNGINSIQAILSDGTSGLRLDSNGLQSSRNGRWGMVPSIICYGRAYSTPSNAYIRRCKSYNGDIPTITRMSSTMGYLRMNIPSSWTTDGFSESTVQIMLTGFGQSRNGSASNMSEFLIKATVLSVTSSEVYIGLSDDDTGNDGEFYFEMKWL
ncbi:hypothetical protein [Bacteroides faecis]|uniref:hypothetical protein n=2 Tax=Bacteroides faecis TaxID=674529 RepID=UPI0032EDEA3D